MNDLQATLLSQYFQTIDRENVVVMAQRQMFVWATLQFEFRKKVLDARIKTLVVRHHHDNVSAFIQQFFASLQGRKGIAGVLEDVQHRDDIVFPREMDLFDRAMVYGKAGFLRNIFRDVL